jgi:hypothetical protein
MIFWDVRESRADMASQIAEFFCGVIFQVIVASEATSQGIHSAGELLRLNQRGNRNATIHSQKIRRE